MEQERKKHTGISPGDQFGQLTVIGDEGTQSGDHVWRCRCACGNECLATTSHLTHGHIKSCGCVRCSVWESNFKLVDGTSVTKLEACRNGEKLSAVNTSGYTGVYPQSSHGRRTGRWAAQIGFKGKKYYLGVFDRAEDAVKARKRAEELLYDGFLESYYAHYRGSPPDFLIIPQEGYDDLPAFAQVASEQ